MDFEAKIFGSKSFSDILKNIYDNSREKEKQIKDLITGLKPLVVDTQSALMVVPLIRRNESEIEIPESKTNSFLSLILGG